MTDDEHRRLTKALCEKVARGGAIVSEWSDMTLEDVVGTVVADTALFCDGVITLEMLEDREPQPGDGPEYHTDHAFWEM